MKVGLLGGTFDPIHNGHLALADEARLQFGLDEVWIIPAGDPYFKTREKEITLARYRLGMISKAIENINWLRVNTCEIERKGPTFSADTVYDLKQHYPNIDFYWIMGEDAFLQIKEWYHYEYFISSINILVARRLDRLLYINWDKSQELIEEFKNNYNTNIQLFSFDYDISSTQIRQLIHSNRSYQFMLPNSVYNFIERNGLYKEKI